MKVLVTGGTGHLGRTICQALAEAGHDVLAADSKWRDLPVPLELVDLLEPRVAYRLTAGCDAVVHLANHPGVMRHVPRQQTYSENAALDINVFHAAFDRGIRKLIFASSIQVIAGRRNGEDDIDKPSCLPYLPMDGHLPTQPGNVYALSKEAGELQLKYFAEEDPGLCCTALRLPWMMSERHIEWIRRHRREAQRYRRHGRGLGNIDECASYLAMSDAASLIDALVRDDTPGFRALLPAAPDNMLGRAPKELIEQYYPNVPLRVPAEEMKSLVDISEITDWLGWKPEVVGMFGPDQDGNEDPQ